jgi:mRNA interferase MazF
MRRLSVISEPGDVVVVPFPFSERPGVKRRPALALSSSTFSRKGHTVLAMITTKQHSPWPGDVVIRDLEVAGLQHPCIVRLKLFTLDNRLALRRLGHLGDADLADVEGSLQTHLLC